jgi:hypothetical protein
MGRASKFRLSGKHGSCDGSSSDPDNELAGCAWRLDPNAGNPHPSGVLGSRYQLHLTGAGGCQRPSYAACCQQRTSRTYRPSGEYYRRTAHNGVVQPIYLSL